MRNASAALLCLVLAACELGPPTSGTSSVGARDASGSCPAALLGEGAPGAPCRTYGDCRELCCACSSGAKGFAGAACVDGRCAAQAETCRKAEESSTTVCR